MNTNNSNTVIEFAENEVTEMGIDFLVAWAMQLGWEETRATRALVTEAHTPTGCRLPQLAPWQEPHGNP
jgi:hypothetical protein